MNKSWRLGYSIVAGLIAILMLMSCATTLKQPRGSESAKKQNQRTEATLLQAETAIAAGETNRARRALAALPLDGLSNEQKLRRQLSIAKYRLLTDKPQEALNVMHAVDDAFLITVDRDRQIEWFLTYADALAANDAKRTALRVRILLDERLTAKESAANHPAILELIDDMNIHDLLSEVKLAIDLYIRGWYDFAILRKLHPQYGRREPATIWASAYPRHPGHRYLAALKKEQRDIPSPNKVRNIAFLLPFSGSLAPYSEAIYQGYMDAAAEHRTRVQGTRYDTEGDESIAELLDRILADGNQAILGPLRSRFIAELAATNYPDDMPLLVLNELPPNPAGNIHSFELSLEESVAFAARIAQDDGCRRNLLITEASGLGEKMELSLKTLWAEQHNTTLVKQMQLNDVEPAAPQISAFLEVDNAEVEATKEIYRRYLRLLNRLDEDGKGAEELLSAETTQERPRIYPRQDKRLLLTQQEISMLESADYGLVKQDDLDEAALAQTQGNLSLEDLAQLTPDELLIASRAEMRTVYDRVEADCIFLAMDRSRALKVRPFLSFYLANDMKVYGTFLLYDSRLDAQLYEDLNQVSYGEMPAVTNPPSLLSALPADAYGLRFYARGRDLFAIMTVMPDQSADEAQHVVGESGILYRTEQRIIAIPQRVTFSNGLPVPQPGQSVFQ